jgi:hypothetical protein
MRPPAPADVLLCLLVRAYLMGGDGSSSREDLVQLANFLSTCLLHSEAAPGDAVSGLLEAAVRGATSASHGPALVAGGGGGGTGATGAPFPWLSHPLALREQLYQVLSPDYAASLFEDVQERLAAAVQSPHAVADLFGELKALVTEHVERDSTCGRYLRRQILNFERQMFAGVSRLFVGLRAMVAAGPGGAGPPALGVDFGGSATAAGPWPVPVDTAPDTAPPSAVPTTSPLYPGAAVAGAHAAAAAAGSAPRLSDALEGLHAALDRLVAPLVQARRAGVTQHAALQLGALHLSRGNYQSAVTGGTYKGLGERGGGCVAADVCGGGGVSN